MESVSAVKSLGPLRVCLHFSTDLHWQGLLTLRYWWLRQLTKNSFFLRPWCHSWCLSWERVSKLSSESECSCCIRASPMCPPVPPVSVWGLFWCHGGRRMDPLLQHKVTLSPLGCFSKSSTDNRLHVAAWLAGFLRQSFENNTILESLAFGQNIHWS